MNSIFTSQLLYTFLALAMPFILSSQVNFIDISAESGINNIGTNIGVAAGDYDNDGDDDFYISRHNAANILYRNNGDETFTDVAVEAGVDKDGDTHLSVWGDLDNDGDLDLFLGNRWQPNILYDNNGDGTFTELELITPFDEVAKPRALMIADVDRDGLLDIYIANLAMENILYKNNGDMTFTDITTASGATDSQISMGSIFFDYDNDGDQDLYLTHDANQPNILYQNDGNGNFTDVSVASGTNYAGQGMGVDVGDVNRDGWLDIYFTNMGANTLYLNNGDGTFTNIAQSASVTDIGMGWGTTFLDCENDGWNDIYMVNDSNFSPNPNVLYRNNGDNTFDIISENSPVASMFGSYGSVCSDINNDGLLDIFVANNGSDGNQVFKNNTQNAGNYLMVKAEGTISNRSAIGTRVTLETNGILFIDEINAGNSYSSQNGMTLHFGLGNITTIDKMTINWPNGLEEMYENIEVNRTISVVEGQEGITNLNQLERITAFEMIAYPNPFKDNMGITLKVKQNEEHILLELQNSMGQRIGIIHSGSLNQGGYSFGIPETIDELPKGVYFLSATSNTFKVSQKLVKH